MESTWSPGGVHMESVGEGKVHHPSELLEFEAYQAETQDQ